VTHLFRSPSPLRYRDLIAAALHGEPLPICPVAAWRHHPGDDQSAEGLALATLAFQRRFDFDLVKVTPASTWQARDYGLRDAWQDDPIGRRAIVGRVVSSPEDWLHLPELNPWEGFSARILAAVRRVRAQLPRSVPVLATVFNPYFQATQLAGPERLQQHLDQAGDRVARGLAVIAANTRAVIQELVGLGIDGIYLASQHAGKDGPDAHRYADFALADDLACLDTAPLPLNLLHLHGAAVHWQLYRGLRAAVLHYDSSAANPDPVQLAGDYPCGLSTGPTPAALVGHGPAMIEASILALRARMAGGRFVLSPGCAVPLAYRPDNLDALTAAARLPLQHHG
jgi:uroporphyrinogen decarboxylase